MNEQTITRSQVHAAFVTWYQEEKDGIGKCAEKWPDGTGVEQKASESTEYLFAAGA